MFKNRAAVFKLRCKMLPRATNSSTASRPLLGNVAKGEDMSTNNYVRIMTVRPTYG